MKKIVLFLVAIMMSFSLIACDKGGGGEVKDPTISLDKTTLSMYIGEEATLKASIANTDSKAVWKTSNDAVVTVAGGVVRAISAGVANVTASVGKAVATCAITVTESYTIDLTGQDAMIVNEEQNLTAVVKLNGATVATPSVTYSASNDKATVSALGVVTAVSSGSVIITASFTGEGKTVTDSITITISDVKELKLLDDAIYFRELNKTKTVHIEAKLNGVIDTNANVEFEIIDTDIATVDANGVITSLKAGVTELQVAWGTSVFNCPVTVDDITTFTPIRTKAEFIAAFVPVGEAAITTGKYILMADIDLALGAGERLDAAGGRFKLNGILDGNGHYLKNLDYNQGYDYSVFKLGENAIIRNIGFDIVKFNRFSNGAFFGQTNAGTLQNIIFNANLTSNNANYYNSSFLVGVNAGSISNLIMNVEISANDNLAGLNGDSFGAIANNNTGKISNVYCNFTKYGEPYVGDIKLYNGKNATNVLVKSAQEMNSVALFDGWDSDVWAIKEGMNPVLRQENIILNKTNLTMFVGDTQTLIAIQNGDEAVTFTSSEPTIATVDANGLVTAILSGKAIISATVGTGDNIKTATCAITVKPVYTLSVNKTYVSMIKVGETNDEIRVTATVRGIPNSDASEYTWASLDALVATVDANGVITAVKAGSTTITVTYHGITESIHVEITIINTLEQIFTTADFLAIGASDESRVKSYILMNDIDLGGAVKEGLGGLIKFNGVLDGNGFAVKNFVVKTTQTTNNKYSFMALGENAVIRNVEFTYTLGVQSGQSLFGNIAKGATVKDCIFNIQYMGSNTHSWYTGGIAWNNAGDITDCIVKMSNKPSSGTITPNMCAGISYDNTPDALIKNVYVVKADTNNKLVAEPAGQIINAVSKTEAELANKDLYAGWNAEVWDIDAASERAPILKKNLPVMINKFDANIYMVPEQTNTYQIVITKDPSITDEIVCSSSNTAVATVSPTGLVTAVSVGNAKISIKCGWVTLTCNISVQEPVTLTIPTELKLDSTKGSYDFEPLLQILGIDATPEQLATLTWASSNTAVATISNGVLTFIKGGTIDVTVSYTYSYGADKTKVYTATCKVRIIDINDYVKVGTVNEFKAIFATEASAKESYILTNDIDFDGAVLPHTSTFPQIFKGTLDGNGYAVKNFVYDSTYNIGLIKVGDGAFINNIEFGFTSVVGNSQALLGNIPATAKLKNVIFNATVSKITYGNDCSGMIIKTNEGTLENIIVNIKLTDKVDKGNIWALADANNGVLVNGNTKGVMKDVVLTAVDEKGKDIGANIVASKRWNGAIGAGTQVNLAKKTVADSKKHALYATWDASVWTIDATDTLQPSLNHKDIYSVRLNKTAGYDINKADAVVVPLLLLNGVAITTPAELAKIVYVSSNTDVATIAADGKLTLKTVGETTITATYTSGKIISSDTQVVNVTKASLTLDKTTLSGEALGADATLAPTLTINDVVATEEQIAQIVWTSSEQAYATVSAGVVTFLAEGATQITATYTIKGVEYSATCDVTVAKPADVKTLVLGGDPIVFDTLGATRVTAFTATLNGASATPTLTYSVADTSVATVDASGVVTSVARGATELIVSWGGREFRFAITVDGLKTYKKVATADEFKAIFATAPSAKGSYILTNDIDFGGATLKSADYKEALTGTLNGNGYALKNFVDNSAYDTALFKIGANALLTNIGFDFKGSVYVSRKLLGNIPATATLKNIIFNATITNVSAGNDCLGLIIKTNEGTLENIIVNAKLTENFADVAWLNNANCGLLVNSNAKGVMKDVVMTVVGADGADVSARVVASQRWNGAIGAGKQTNVAKKTVAESKAHALYATWDASVWEIDATDVLAPTLKHATI